MFIAGDDDAARRGVRVAPVGARRTERADRAGVVLECHGVTKRFGGITAVDDVDLALPPGEILGLIGHNGAGKTTLFDCISGFLDIDAGRVVLDGDDITELAAARAGRPRARPVVPGGAALPVAHRRRDVAVARERHLANRDMVAAALRLPASHRLGARRPDDGSTS